MLDADFQCAVRGALDAMRKHADEVGIENTDEFTFRAFLMQEIRKACRAAKLETEWNRFDLLVECGEARWLVELKYYVLRARRLLNSGTVSYKGGPGVQNTSEFNACVKKLCDHQHEAITRRVLVLVYQRELPPSKRESYHKSFSNPAKFPAVVATQVVHEWSDMVCWLYEPKPPAAS